MDLYKHTVLSTNHGFPTKMLMLTHHRVSGVNLKNNTNNYRRLIISSFDPVVDENS